MERRYVAVRTVGKPTQILDRIRRVVQEQKLTRTIPVVKFERRPHGEFYVFLAVEGTGEMHLPDRVQTVLMLSRLTGQPFWPLPSDAIKSMVSRAEVETYSLNALTYMSLWSNDAGDPFDLSGASSDAEDSDNASLGEQYDRLLNWLSAKAEGTWQTFAQVCQVLQLADDIKGARSIFRRLILLGYIESSSDGQKWSICPTTLVQGAAEPDMCFLAGQQTPNLIKQLSAHWKIENIPQPRYQGPSRVKVHSNLSADFLADELQVESVGVASVQLASLLPDLEGWKAILTTIDRINTAHCNIEIWNGSRFSQYNTFLANRVCIA